MTTRAVRRAPSEDYIMASAPQPKQSNTAQITVTPLSVPSSVASTSQNCVQTVSENSQRATQYEHVTVVTQLAQQPMSTSSRSDANSIPGNVSYAVSTTAGTSSLQIHPPATLTQQVQLSVPALAGAPLTKVGGSRGGGTLSQSFRNNGARSQKTPLSAMLPMMGRGNPKQLVNMGVIGDDGPTVRQHLQQQQQKARLQQQLAMQAKQKAEEAAKQNLGDGSSQAPNYSQPSSSNDHQSSPTELKTVVRTTHVQRPYTPRVSTAQRQRAAAEAVRQLQLKGASSSGLSGSLPPISLGPSRPAKLSRITSESHNGGEIVTVLQTQPHSASTYRHFHYRSAAQGTQLMSNSTQSTGQPVEQVYQVVNNDIQQFPAQPVVKIETTQISNECQQTSSTSATALGGGPSQQIKISTRKRSQRTQPQVRVTFLEPSKPVDFVCTQSASVVDANCSNSNYSPHVPTSQGVYGAARQAVTTREVAQGEQFYSSPSAPANTATMESTEVSDQSATQRHQVMQHNNLHQKHPQHQLQVVSQHQYQHAVNQQQLQVRNSPQMQTQSQQLGHHRVQQPGSHQQLQEVIVNSQQQPQSMTGQQQQLQQAATQSQPQPLGSQQQQLRAAYQGQQRVVQASQPTQQQRVRRQPNVQNLEQRQEPPPSHLQHHLQTQPQQIQQLQVQQQNAQGRPIHQFRQQSQHVQGGYSSRFQQPRLQQNVANAGSATILTEQRDGIVVRHQNSISVAHHAQLRSLPPGVVSRPPSQIPTSQRIYSLPHHLAQQQREDQKNAALCDEIARLNQRIQTVSDQRRMLAKRLQHHERNRIRRIQTKLKKKKAALEAKLKAFQETPLSINVDADSMKASHEGDANDYNDVDSERTGSPMNPSPSSSVSTSCLGTPDSQPSGSTMRVGSRSSVRTSKPKVKVSKHRKLESNPPIRMAGRKMKKSSPG